MKQLIVQCANSILLELCGKIPYSISIGVGTFLLIDFPPPVLNHYGRYFGMWHLWVQCHWRITRNRIKIADSRLDGPEILNRSIKILSGLPVSGCKISRNKTSMKIWFSNQIVLTVFRDQEYEGKQWVLFLPRGKTISLTHNGLLGLNNASSS